MNLYDMEENVRMERLVEFKTAYGASRDALERCLCKFCPELDAGKRRRFLYAFLPFVFGLYPYASVTEKQREAMQAAGVPYSYPSAYELAYDGIKTLLNGLY